MALIVEIFSNDIDAIGGCREGSYNYVVKVNRKTIASGEVTHDRRTHWSLLLKKIAEDGRIREYDRVVDE